MGQFDSTISTSTYDQLFTGNYDVVKDAKTVLSGEVLTRGAVLGKVTLGAATSAEVSGDNTGDGTLVLDATTPILANAQAGIYTVRVTRAAIAEIATTPVVSSSRVFSPRRYGTCSH